MYCLFCDVPCIVCVYMCTEQLSPGGYPIAVKYVSYHIFDYTSDVLALLISWCQVGPLLTQALITE